MEWYTKINNKKKSHLIPCSGGLVQFLLPWNCPAFKQNSSCMHCHLQHGQSDFLSSSFSVAIISTLMLFDKLLSLMGGINKQKGLE